jgi:hypothetical protein
MSLMLDAARVAAAVNILLLVGLIGVWLRSYREIKAPLTLGFIVFAVLLLAENAVALYLYLTAPAIPNPAVRLMMVVQILETGGVGVLAYVAWQ